MVDMTDMNKALPPPQILALAKPDVPIRNTVGKFLGEGGSSFESAEGVGNISGFARACQLHNAIEQLEKQVHSQRTIVTAAATRASASADTRSDNEGKKKSRKGKKATSTGHDDGSEASLGLLEFYIEHAEGESKIQLDEDELVAFFLNAEYAFVKMYEGFLLRANPFLFHWVESHQRLSNKYIDELGDGRDDNGFQMKHDEELRLVKIRVGFFEMILNDHSEVFDETPLGYASNPTMSPVYINKCNAALIEQGVFESLDEIPWVQDRKRRSRSASTALAGGGNLPMESKSQVSRMQNQDPPSNGATGRKGNPWNSSSNIPTPPPGLPDRLGYFQQTPASTQQQQQQFQQQSHSGTPINHPQGPLVNESAILNKLITTLLYAQQEELNGAETGRLVEHFSEYPAHLFAVLEPSEEILGALATVNPVLARALVQIYLHAAGQDSLERKEILNNLPRLPVSLGVLELLNHIIAQSVNEILAATINTPPNSSSSSSASTQINKATTNQAISSHPLLAKNEINLLLHNYLANAMMKAESIGGPGSEGGMSPGSNPLTYQHPTQTQMVRLLCLFVQALMTKGFIRLEEYYYEVYELGVRYIFVKEARDLLLRMKGK